MAKDKITEYDATAANNTDVGGVNLAENSMNPSDVNNAIREVLSHQKEAFGSGTPLFVDQTNNRVGVNKTPTVALDVSGAVDIAGNLSVDGGTIKLDGNFPTGTNNLAFGDGALDASLTGASNTAIGSFSLTNNTSGASNTGLGFASLGDNTTGSFNTGLGTSALESNTTASQNTAVGYEALKTNTGGSENVAIGYEALFSNTTAHTNQAFGYRCLKANTTGSGNTGVGHQVLLANTTATNNTAVGGNAGLSITTGSNNTFIGSLAGDANTTGASNVALGRASLTTNIDGASNVAIGVSALEAVASSNNNVAVGTNCLVSTTGSNNTAIGNGAGSSITSGTKNTIVGQYNGNESGLDIRTSSNNIVLSDGDGNPRVLVNSNGFTTFTDNRAATASRLGSSTNAHIIHSNSSGNIMTFVENTSSDPRGMMFDFSQAAPDNNTNFFMKFEDSAAERAHIFSDGDMKNHDGTFVQNSDERIKQNITDANSQWDDIKAIRFINYKAKDDVRQYGEDNAKIQLGVLAQEMEKISPKLVKGYPPSKADVISSSEFGTLYEDGDTIPDDKVIGDVKEVKDNVKGIAYSVLYMKAVKALQEAMTRIETLETKVKALEG